MAEALIGGALVGVLEHVVGLVELLEFMLAILVAGIAVRMVLHRELAVRGLHIGLARTALNTQDFEVISLCHYRHASPSCLAADRGAVRICLIRTRKTNGPALLRRAIDVQYLSAMIPGPRTSRRISSCSCRRRPR